MIVDTGPGNGWRRAVVLAYLRWIMPPDKWALFDAGHAVSWTRRWVIPIPFVGKLVIERDVSAGPS